MELLDAHQITRYQRGEPLFQPLDLQLRSGARLGVVGPNGCGKSTLLHLLAGLTTPDEGRVVRRPGVRLGYLPQTPRAMATGSVWSVASAGLGAVREAEARLRQEERRLARGEDRESALADALSTFEALGGYRAEPELREVLAALGFPERAHDGPVARLSEGERRRLALAGTLAGTPELLLLDEPTNHLDIAVRGWLAERLARHPGAVVVVSHDRALLDRATTATLFLGEGPPELRRGGYGRARRAREHALHALRRRDAEREKEARRLRAMAAALAKRGDRGAARRRLAADRRAASLAALDAETDAAAADDRTALSLPTRGLQGVLLDARALARAGVLDVPHVRLVAGRRVALLGPNGSGKSTLLGLLAGSLPSDDARSELRYAPRLRLAVVDQLSRGLHDGDAVLAQLERVTSGARARQLLAESGLRAEQWSRPPEHLSGGERARAGLALLQAREADLLLLDEPSNDLDLPALEALERALRQTHAGVVLATHDRRLAEDIADEVWALQDGTLRSYPDVASYLAGGGGVPPGGTGLSGEREAPTPRTDTPAAGRSGGPADLGQRVTRRPVPAGDAGAPQEAGDPPRLDALEDEALTVERLLEDPLMLAPRELERLRSRRRSLQEQLALAYDARLAPPAPRFHVRERGLAIVADRHADGLLVMAIDEAVAPAAMAALHRIADGAPAPGDEALVAPWPWARVTPSGPVAHVALVEPPQACLLSWGRAALADAAARLAFTLLDVSAVQLFSRQPLADTRLQDAGDGWWTWTRGAFARSENLPEDAGARGRMQSRARRRRARKARGS